MFCQRSKIFMSPFGSFSLILYFRSIFIFFALISSTALSAEGVRFAYVANPYDYTISEFYVDENGVMFPNGMVYTKDKYPSTLIIHPTGKFIYSASRTVDTAPIYQIDPVTGWLSETPESHFDTRLRSPFSYGFHPNGKFLYVAGRGGGVAGFTVDEKTGALGYVPGSPFKAGERTRCLTIHPSGKFIYASNAYTNNVTAYRVNEKTGSLIQLPSSPFPAGEVGPFDDTISKLPDVTDNKGGMPYYIASHPSGEYVYVTNSVAASVSVFRVNQETGDLTLVGVPVQTGLNPYAVAVHPSGKYVYVSTWGGNDLWAYSVNLKSGELTRIDGSPFETLGMKPVDITFNNDGSRVYVSNNGSNSVSIFDADVATGKLTLKDFAMTRAGAIDIELLSMDKPVSLVPDFAFLIDKESNQLFSYRINIQTGDLQEVARIKTGKQPVAIAKDPLNRFVYVANSASDNVSAFAIDRSTGALTEIEGSPYVVGKKPGDIVIDANGWYLYSLNQEPQDISVFLIHFKKGQLAEAQGSPVAVGKQPFRLSGDRTSRYIYVSNRTDKSVNVYRYRTAVTPSIFEITHYGSPFVFESLPTAVVNDPTGRFVMVLQKEKSLVAMFFAHASTGELVPIEGNLQPYQLKGNSPIDAVFHPNGKFAYVLNSESDNISQLKVERMLGVLSELDKPVAANGKPLSITIDPSGQYLYVVNKNEKGLRKYTIDKSTGKLNDAGKVALPYVPESMEISRDFR